MSIKLVITIILYVFTGGAIFSRNSSQFKYASILAGLVAIAASFIFWRDAYEEFFDFIADRVAERLDQEYVDAEPELRIGSDPVLTLEELSQEPIDGASYSFIEFLPKLAFDRDPAIVHAEQVSEKWEQLEKQDASELAKFAFLWDGTIEALLAKQKLKSLLAGKEFREAVIVDIQNYISKKDTSVVIDGEWGPGTARAVKRIFQSSGVTDNEPDADEFVDLLLNFAERFDFDEGRDQLYRQAVDLQAVDPLGAYKLLELSCEFGASEACSEQAVLAYRVKSLGVSDVTATDKLVKACSLGNVRGCMYARRFSGDRDAQPLIRPVANYPEKAAQLGLEGSCDVRFTVSDLGAPIEVLASCSDEVFEEEAVKAVSGALFSPAIKNGVPTARTNVVYPLEFTLAD